MQSAETILRVIHDRGRRGLPLERVYRLLFNPTLYLAAYRKLAANRGALTPGVTAETVDGMSLHKIQTIIRRLRSERYRWTPVRRVYIEKRTSTKKRPLGLPTWSDKLLQDVIRLILQAYYDPQFSPHSHGFRPGRGCHTALREVYHRWHGTTWFIEGDISAYFDSIDHQVLLEMLREKIHDNRFVRLIGNLLKAGYLEDWRYHPTLSGTPQGGVVSPILANLYLDRLDRFVEQTLLPECTRGARRKQNLTYNRLKAAASALRRKGQREQAAQLRRAAKRLPSVDPYDPDFRRLSYVRYADDFLLGFTGPHAEAEAIKRRLGAFLQEQLRLELSATKTLITHGRTGTARFLGYDLSLGHNDRRRNRRGNRNINGLPSLRVPSEVIRAKCRPYLHHGRPSHRDVLLHDAPFSIVRQYQAEYAGLVEYYRLAFNLHRFQRLKWIMEVSLTKTLAKKLRLSVPQVYRRFHATLATPRGSRRGLQVVVPRARKPPLVATWGGINLDRRVGAVLNDAPPVVWSNTRSELIQRLLADTCELCGVQEKVEVHHIRALRDLQQLGRPAPPAWVIKMAARQRKTLAVCQRCHLSHIHGAASGQRIQEWTRRSGEPGAVKVARPVRRGADGKVPSHR
jgi:group II intron reverse transcriptase/maturase